MFRKKPSVVAQAVIDSLRTHPDKWNATEHKLFLGASRGQWHEAPIQIWISNGVRHVALTEPSYTRFQLHDKEHVWAAFQRWQGRQPNVDRFLELLKAAEAA